MNFFTEYKIEIKLFFIVALAAVVIAVAGILLLKAMQPASPAAGPAPVAQTPSSVPQAVPTPILEGQFYGCKIDNDCVLVQDGWCGTVLAVNKDKEAEWENENSRQTEFARQSRQTCKPTTPENLDPNNFIPICQNSKCFAIPKLDRGASLSVDTSGWQTYRNAEYGFEVRYPKEFVVKENLKYVEGVIQEYGSPVDVLVGFPDSAYANSLTHGALHINRIVKPEINCMGFEYSQSPPVVKIINGVSFTETSSGNGAMGRSDDRKRYNTMHRGICYQIDRVIVTINYYKELDGEWVDPKEVEKKLDQILATFRFVEQP